MAETEPKRATGLGIAASGNKAAATESQGMPVESNLVFADFSKAFDHVQEARKTVEKYGTARLANPPAPEVLAAQKAFDDAVKRYNAIVAALIKPKF
jgi:hypothetical protein